MNEVDWLLCPVCKNKTRIKLRQDTTLTNFPLFCPKCKQETVINVKQLTTIIIKEPDESKSTRRRQLDSVLDGFDDNDLIIMETAAKGITQAKES